MISGSKKIIAVLTGLRNKAKNGSAQQSTFADNQRSDRVREQYRARATALNEVANWLDEEIKKL